MPTAADEKRLRVYRIDHDMLVDILNGRIALGPDCLPPDAKVVRAWIEHDFSPPTFALVIASHTFDPVPDFERIPEAGAIRYMVGRASRMDTEGR